MTEEESDGIKTWVCLHCGKRVKRSTHPGDYTGGPCRGHSDGRHLYS